MADLKNIQTHVQTPEARREKRLEDSKRKLQESKEVIFMLSPDDLFDLLVSGSNIALVLEAAKPKTLSILFDKMEAYIDEHTFQESVQQLSVLSLIMQNDRALMGRVLGDYDKKNFKLKMLLILHTYRPTFNVKINKHQQVSNLMSILDTTTTYKDDLERLVELNLQKPLTAPVLDEDDKKSMLSLMELLTNNSVDSKFRWLCFLILKDIGGISYLENIVCEKKNKKFTVLQKYSSGHYMKIKTNRYKSNRRMFDLVRSFTPKEDNAQIREASKKPDFMVHAYLNTKNIILKNEYLQNCNRLITIKASDGGEMVYDLIKTSTLDTWQERLNKYSNNKLDVIQLEPLWYSEVKAFCEEHQDKFISIQSSIENRININKRPRVQKRKLVIADVLDSGNESTSSKSSKYSHQD